MIANGCLKQEEQQDAQTRFETAEQLRRRMIDNPHGDLAVVKEGYSKYIEFVKRKCRHNGGSVSKLPVDTKMNVVTSLIWISYCDLQQRNTSGPEMMYYDDPRGVAEILDQLELELRSYEVGRPEVYNLLQCRYDEWCEQFRAQGRKYEADELQYYMLRARMKWSLAQLIHKIPQLGLDWEQLVIPLRSALAKPLAQWEKASEKYHVFADAIRAFFEWLLYWFGKSLVRPFLFFIVIPIMVFAAIYQGFGCSQTLRYDSYLIFSTLVFTGSDASSLASCAVNGFHTTMAIEALWAYIFAIVVISYLVNRLSNR